MRPIAAVRMIRYFRTDVITAIVLGLCAVAGQAQTVKGPAVKPGAKLGKQLFASNCAACHGIDGKGSERAPNIADAPAMKSHSDSEIFGIIHDGISGTGMPAFHALSTAQIHAIVAHLRALEGPSQNVAVTGNAEKGKTLFFGNAECSRCHTVAGEGGLTAQDLSEYARGHGPDQVRAAILHPAPSGRMRPVKVTLRGGQQYEGLLRNEDNFSFQLQTADGRFHFIAQSDVEKTEAAPNLVMPSDYGSRLNTTEVDDLIAYLTKVASTSKAATETKRRREYLGEE